MIQMEYPKLPLEGLTPEAQIRALKRQVDILTDNLQIVLNSIENDSNELSERLTASDVGALPISGGTLTGNLALEGHSSPIGWYDALTDTTSLDVAVNFTEITGASLTLTPGRYIILAAISFPANATGYRGMAFNINGILTEGSSLVAACGSGWTTKVNGTIYRQFNTETEVKLAYVQNSGGALNTSWILKAIRIR